MISFCDHHYDDWDLLVKRCVRWLARTWRTSSEWILILS
jgi:hypothetical protein